MSHKQPPTQAATVIAPRIRQHTSLLGKQLPRLACFGAVWMACGPSYDESTIKTPQDRLREQEELAYKEELEAQNQRDQGGGNFEDPNAAGAFDQNQADLEMKRATLSAETCVDVVTEEKMPYGKTMVTITFALDGSVAEASIPPPYTDTQLGNCVLNAYRGIYLPPYVGEREVLSWEVSLEKPSSK